MTYKLRDMVGMLFIGMIIGVLIMGATIIDAKGADQGICHSPCIVKLPRGTEEDEFRLDYGRVNHRPEVRVWVDAPRKGGR